MNMNRSRLILAAFVAFLIAFSAGLRSSASLASTFAVRSASAAPERGLPYVPVVTPNGSTLPFQMKDGVKEFRLVAEPVKREFAPGMVVNAWGYNGSTP